jgi:hypothetical protein
MSQIYDAVKAVEAERSVRGAPARDSLGVMEMPEQRLFSRSESSVPLTVYGRAADGSPFYREADGVNMSPDGGLIVIRASVCEGEELLLINNRSSQEQLCRVVHVSSRDTDTSEVGVAFPSPNLTFWELSEPPSPEEHSNEGF